MAEIDLLNTLRRAELRATPQRLAICDLLIHSDQHPTAFQIFEKIKPDYPSLSLATVYNTLDVLVGLGLVISIGSVGDDRVHYDANLFPHINLACKNCHRIVDIEMKEVEQLGEEVARKSGFDIDGSRILYYGTCPDCLEQSKKMLTNS